MQHQEASAMLLEGTAINWKTWRNTSLVCPR